MLSGGERDTDRPSFSTICGQETGEKHVEHIQLVITERAAERRVGVLHDPAGEGSLLALESAENDGVEEEVVVVD